MRHFVFILIFVAFATLQGWAQKKAPEEKSIVKKEYDENGNLIQYDSTYVWKWNSDSTFNFSFGDKFAFGKDLPEMFGEFFNDSIFNFHFGQPFPDNFGFGDFGDLQKQLQEKFNHRNLIFPEFKSPEQQQEWEKLIQKQQKEKEELMKKREKE